MSTRRFFIPVFVCLSMVTGACSSSRSAAPAEVRASAVSAVEQASAGTRLRAGQVEPHVELQSIHSLVVAPVKAGAAASREIDRHTIQMREIGELAVSQLRGDMGIEVHTAGEYLPSLRKRSGEPSSSLSESLGSEQLQIDVLQREAARAGAGALVFIEIHELVERSGSRLGTETPAALAFSVRLVGVGEHDGRELWRRQYRLSDEALTDNLLDFKRRVGKSGPIRWRSARDLVAEGLAQASAELAAARTEQFLRN